MNQNIHIHHELILPKASSYWKKDGVAPSLQREEVMGGMTWANPRPEERGKAVMTWRPARGRRGSVTSCRCRFREDAAIT